MGPSRKDEQAANQGIGRPADPPAPFHVSGERAASEAHLNAVVSELLSSALDHVADWVLCDLRSGDLHRAYGKAVLPALAEPVAALARALLTHADPWAASDGTVESVARFISAPVTAEEPFKAALEALGCAGMIRLPLVSPHGRIGTLILARRANAPPCGPTEMTIARGLAGRAATALENACLLAELRRERAESESARRRFAFLAEASRLMTESLDLEPTLRAVARLCIPAFADWSAVVLVPVEGELQRVAIETTNPKRAGLARRLLEGYRMDRSAKTAIGEVLRTGRSAFLPDTQATLSATAATDEAGRSLLNAAGITSFLCVPMVARGHAVGTLSLGMSESGRRFAEGDLELAEEVGRRAALAIDNARLYAGAQQAIALREQFLAVASHELKTPVTALALNAESLERAAKARPGEMSEASLERVAAMRRQVRQLSDLILRLLDVSRMQAGRQPLVVEPIDLGSLVTSIVARARDQANRTSSTLSVRAESPVEGTWDRLRLDEVITNLLDNALKYGAGHPIEVGVGRRGEHAFVRVQDQGIGIAPGDQARIFGRFERAASLDNFGGFGLGLWISREIIEAHGGRIEVESTPGRGATFQILLPLTPTRS